MLDRLSLVDRTIIVTGGGTGLGRATVLALAKAGASLVIAARRNGPIQEIAAEVCAQGCRALAVPTDVTDSEQVNKMVHSAMEEFGKVDVLINNAGIVREHKARPLWEISDAEWRVGIDVNLTSAFYCSRAVSEHMVKRGSGKIINVASGFGLRGGRDNYMYAAGKGGIVNFTRVLATSLSRYGVIATCVVPGFIDTTEQGGKDGRGEFIPIGRTGRAEEIGPVMVYLASDASNYTNGALFTLDGGALAGGYAPTGFTLPDASSAG